MDTGIVMQQMIIIIFLILTGYVLSKKGLVTSAASPALSAMVVNVCNPASLISGSLNRDPSISNMMVLYACLAVFVMYACLLTVSFFLPRFFAKKQPERSYYQLMCLFGNTGFIGIPLVTALLGSQALIYVAVVNAFYNLLYYSFGLYLVSGGEGKFNPRKLINMGNISIILTVLIFCLNLKLPAVFANTVTAMANGTTLLAMIVIGISIANQDLKDIFIHPKMYLFTALRFLLFPIAMSFLLRQFVHDNMLYMVVVIMCAVPAGNLPLMGVEEAGKDGRLLSRGIVLSTLFSVVTIPIVSAFL